MRCTSCHSQIVQGLHVTVTESVCFTCHFKDEKHDGILSPIAGCTKCHEVPVGEIQTTLGGTFDHKRMKNVACAKCHFDTVQGNGDVPRQVCLTCHGEPEKLARYEDHDYLHEWHVTKRKVECFRCHSEIRHGLHPAKVDVGGTCATCHASGHVSAEQLYAGTGGIGVEGSVHEHYKTNVDCVACHDTPPSADVLGKGPAAHRATEQACIACHGKVPQGKPGRLARLQSGLDEQLGEVKAALTKAEAAYAALSEDNDSRADIEALLANARHNYQFVRDAKGVHNPLYAEDLLYKAQDDAEEALKNATRAKQAEGTASE